VVFLFTDLKSRPVALGQYIAEHGATVRDAAAVFGISKSTVHKDVTEKLRRESPSLYKNVSSVLEKNKAERHLRGGEATRHKYELLKLSSSVDNGSEQ
jgi:putative DeoR family transcriptional regulator (stage III sporulation protein D)